MFRMRRWALLAPAVLGTLLTLSAVATAQVNTPGQQATENLFALVLAFGLGIGIFVMILLAVVVLKFRKRKGHTEPRANPKTYDAKIETVWTVVPAVILLVVGIATFQTLHITDTVPQNPDLTVRVVGHQWFWEFFVDNGTGFGPAQVGEFTVKANQTVKLLIESVDVAHSLYIPAFGLKVDAIPGHVNVYWFQAVNPGTYEIRCAEFCGVNHYTMVATLHVLQA